MSDWDDSPEGRDCAANAQYWSDRARVYHDIDAARSALFALKGKTVTVTRGRKVPKGTTGVVFWTGLGKAFRDWEDSPIRLGLKDADGNTHWVDATYVEEKELVSA
jgi:hypothetical protein